MNTYSIEQARVAVAAHCAECGAQCCKKGVLNIGVAEAVKAVKLKPFLLEEWDGTLSLKLTPKCPALEGTSCSIYEQRPSACRNYPFFVYGNNVVTGPCPPLDKGLLDKEIKAIKDAGFRLV